MSNSLNHHDLAWILRRLPNNLLELLKANPAKVFVAGGFIRSCIAHEPVNDIDLFCESKDEAHRLAGILTGADGSRIHETENALTVRGYKLPIQVIHRWTFQNVIDCVMSFDFTIASAALFWNSEKWQTYCDDDFYADLAGKRLIYRSPVRNEDPGGSMLRVLKFYQRGYRIPLSSLAGVIARLLQGIPEEKLEQLEAVKRGRFPKEQWERQTAAILTGLLREVDPAIDPSHISHLPDPGEIEPEPESVSGPSAGQANDILGKPHYS